jgi:probable HAF family extracellular repeat protein
MKTIHLFKSCRLIHAAALSVSLGLGFPASANDQHSYIIDLNSKKVTDLGTLGGGNTQARAINDAGQVVGESKTTDGSTHAFMTGPNGQGMTDLGTLGGDISGANGINAAGQVVGYSATDKQEYYAFITGPGGVGMSEHGSMETAFGINSSGRVVGRTWNTHAAVTGPDGTGIVDLNETFEGRGHGEATAINDSGQVVGWTLPSGGRIRDTSAFITGANAEGMTLLSGSFAQAINAAGQVAGTVRTYPPGSGPPGFIHAFITAPNETHVIDLGTLGGKESFAWGINDAGRVVGSSDMPDGRRHAFITGPDGVGMTDLNSLVSLPEGVVLSQAIAINNSGQVVALSVPEPASYALMLVGLGLVGLMANRRKQGRVVA